MGVPLVSSAPLLTSATLGVVLLVISVALWLVFTPKRLTPIVRQVADKIITAEHEVGLPLDDGGAACW